MKKKRILAGIAAAVMAITMCFAFTACKDKDENIEEDNTVTDNTEDNTQTEGENLGDNSVLTEEQWIKAWQDTAAVKSYLLVESEGHTSNNNTLMEMWCDNVNKTAYENIPDIENGETYFEIVDGVFTRYRKNSETGKWESSSSSYPPQYQWTAEDTWVDTVDYLQMFMEKTFGITGTDKKATFIELYDYAEYNADTKAYELHLYTDGDHFFEIQFSGGYFYRLNFHSTDYLGNPYIDQFTFTNLNSTVVTIPEEIKAEAQN